MCEYLFLFVVCLNVMYYLQRLAQFWLDLHFTSFHYYYNYYCCCCYCMNWCALSADYAFHCVLEIFRGCSGARSYIVAFLCFLNVIHVYVGFAKGRISTILVSLCENTASRWLRMKCADCHQCFTCCSLWFSLLNTRYCTLGAYTAADMTPIWSAPVGFYWPDYSK